MQGESNINGKLFKVFLGFFILLIIIVLIFLFTKSMRQEVVYDSLDNYLNDSFYAQDENELLEEESPFEGDAEEVIPVEKSEPVEEGMKPGNYHLSLIHDKLTRTYQLYIPKQYNQLTNLPLVISLHGAGGSSDNAKIISGFDAKSEEEGFVVVYPESEKLDSFIGMKRGWNAGTCSAEDNIADDAGFISVLIDELKTKLNIDPKRVYVAGMSNGGMMAYRLACELSDKITAVAVVAGSMSLDFDKCSPSRPVPLLHIHGMADNLVRLIGGSGTKLAISGCAKPPILETMAEWKENNGCSGKAVEDHKNNKVTCLAYESCPVNADVNLCIVNGVGHTWPEVKGFSTTDYIWEFFNQYEM